jgi:CAI-1 autoinducer synthase
MDGQEGQGAHNMSVRHSCPGDSIDQEPEFLHKRVSSYHSHVDAIWQGRRPFLMSRAPGAGDVHLFNNDYLAISNHPDITAAQIASLKAFGSGPMMSQIFFTEDSPQSVFERDMAKYLQSGATMLCQSGWCANTGLIQSIASPDTPVYIDLLAHMSLWEGILSARAIPRPFRHNDPSHLERLVKQYGPGIVIVDSVYSINGDVCDLEAIVDCAMAYGCIIVVDESHSLGVCGPEGAGMVVEKGLTDRVHFRTSSLAKGFIGRGGIIVGSEKLIGYIRHEARPMIFSSAVLPTDLAAFSAAKTVIRRDEWRREKMRSNADYLRAGIADLGYNVTDSKSQIISLEAGVEADALFLRDRLEEQGIFGAIFFPPATPKNRALVRFSVDASLTQDDLDRVIKVCHAIRPVVKMHEWRSTRRLQRSALTGKKKVVVTSMSCID